MNRGQRRSRDRNNGEAAVVPTPDVPLRGSTPGRGD